MKTYRIRIHKGAAIVRQSDGQQFTTKHQMTLTAERDEDSGCMLFYLPGSGICYVQEAHEYTVVKQQVAA